MATLYRRDDSPYWWCYGYDAAGERWLASTKQTSRRAAEKAARAIERERVSDVVAPYAAVSVSEALDVLRAHKLRKKCRPGTMEKFAQKRAQLERVLGADTDVHGLSLASFERYTDTRRHDLVHRVELGTDADGKRTRTSADRPVSDQTIAMEVEVLLAALRRLRKHSLYGGEPGELMPDELREATYTPRERWLTVDEYRALHGTFAEGKRRYLAAYVHTGMRLSELYQCERIGDVLRVTQTKGNAKVGEVRTREVPIAAELLPVLDAHPLPWPRYPNAHMNDDLKRACQRVGIERVSANDLRRTFCSWLCNAGVPELAVIRLMGHSSSAMVRRVYAQLAPSTLEDAIARLPRVEVT
jgi:integrase